MFKIDSDGCINCNKIKKKTMISKLVTVLMECMVEFI